VVSIAAVLASFGFALLVEHAAHLHVNMVITAVVLAATLSLIQRGADPTTRAIGAGVLTVAAAAASLVTTIFVSHPNIGDALFVLALATAIWIRRFGPHATKAGAALTLPFIALLAMPGQAAPSAADHLWAAVIAAGSAVCVSAVQLSASRVGFIPRTAKATALPASPASHRSPKRLLASTRMALQMGASVGAAFVVGRLIYPHHWTWVVLTAYIVCSGARGRGDVLHKGALRTVGAASGTIVAVWIAGYFGPHDGRSVALIFAILAFATWLRSVSYAYWAACVTAAISLLYGYFGENAPALLETRLEAILVGAVIGTAASWLILPIRTRDLLRRRVEDSLAALEGFLDAHDTDAAAIHGHRIRFDHSIAQLTQIAPPLVAHRALVRPRRSKPHRADAIDAVRQCVRPVHDIARHHGDTDHTQVKAAMTEIDAAMVKLAAVYKAVPA
jgi:hypothetical protein